MGACESSESGSNSNNIGDLLDSMLEPNKVTSEARISALESKITNKIIKNSNKNEQLSVNIQNLTVRYSDSYRENSQDPFYRQKITKHKGPFGLIEKCGPVPLFFCNYDINQRLNYNVRTFNDSLLDETENISKEIIQHIKKEAEIKYANDPGKLDVAMRAIDESLSLIEENVSERITNESVQTNLGTQTMEIIISEPIRCLDPCDPTKQPSLTQEAQVEVLSQQIISSSLKIIENVFKSKSLDVKHTLDTTNKACILMLMIILCSCFICLIITWQIIKMAG